MTRPIASVAGATENQSSRQTPPTSGHVCHLCEQQISIELALSGEHDEECIAAQFNTVPLSQIVFTPAELARTA